MHFWSGIRHGPVAVWQSLSIPRDFAFGEILREQRSPYVRLRRSVSQSVAYSTVDLTNIELPSHRARAVIESIGEILHRSEIGATSEKVGVWLKDSVSDLARENTLDEVRGELADVEKLRLESVKSIRVSSDAFTTSLTSFQGESQQLWVGVATSTQQSLAKIDKTILGFEAAVGKLRVSSEELQASYRESWKEKGEGAGFGSGEVRDPGAERRGRKVASRCGNRGVGGVGRTLVRRGILEIDVGHSWLTRLVDFELSMPSARIWSRQRSGR